MPKYDLISARDHLSTERRNASGVRLGIDPGFLNHRLLRSFLPAQVWPWIRDRIGGDADDHERRLHRDHLLTRLSLAKCEKMGAPTLSTLLASGQTTVGTVVCSTDFVRGRKAVYRDERVSIPVLLPADFEKSVVLEFATENIVSSTTRLELSEESFVAYIGTIRRIDGETITIAPLIIGGLALEHDGVDEALVNDLFMYSYAFFETFIEDIDEFAAVRDVGRAADSNEWKILEHVPEATVKAAITGLLHDEKRKDWGGEMSDHFSSTIHLSGRRTTAAFLLKGPARFAPMTARHLGKNGDQIYRLACEPAELLILQHSHLVTEPVRAQLRAFAVAPGSRRRFCIVDGPDTYRLLKAYNQIPDVAAKPTARRRVRPSATRSR